MTDMIILASVIFIFGMFVAVYNYMAIMSLGEDEALDYPRTPRPDVRPTPQPLKIFPEQIHHRPAPPKPKSCNYCGAPPQP